MNDIGLRIKQIRGAYEINQIEFAKRIGVTNAHISAMEKGKTIPSPSLIKLICKEFNINEQWLVDGVSVMEIEELEEQTETILGNTVSRFNKIRTRDNLAIRSRVAQIEELCADILEFAPEHEETNLKYLDICFKIFYHLNSYLDFQKKSFNGRQSFLPSFPFDLPEGIKKDINELEKLFNLENE